MKQKLQELHEKLMEDGGLTESAEILRNKFDVSSERATAKNYGQAGKEAKTEG